MGIVLPFQIEFYAFNLIITSMNFLTNYSQIESATLGLIEREFIISMYDCDVDSHKKVIARVQEELKNESEINIWISYVYCVFPEKVPWNYLH